MMIKRDNNGKTIFLKIWYNYSWALVSIFIYVFNETAYNLSRRRILIIWLVCLSPKKKTEEKRLDIKILNWFWLLFKFVTDSKKEFVIETERKDNMFLLSDILKNIKLNLA
jgi:hypothetical protein